MTHLDDGLGDEGVQVGHQLAVDVGHAEVLSHDGDEANGAVTDPQVGVTQEGGCRETWDTWCDSGRQGERRGSGGGGSPMSPTNS